jgi:hypothetical protein
MDPAACFGHMAEACETAVITAVSLLIAAIVPTRLMNAIPLGLLRKSALGGPSGL